MSTSRTLFTSIVVVSVALAGCVVDGAASHEGSLDRSGDVEQPHCGLPSASVPADEATIYYQDNFDFVASGNPIESVEGIAITTEQDFMAFPRTTRDENLDEQIDELDPVALAVTVSCTKTCGPGAGRCRARGCLPMIASGECSECTCYNPWEPNDQCPECTCTATVTATDAPQQKAGQ
jgi:hypothetical protein